MKKSLPQKFMPAYDIDWSDGSVRLNLVKAALLPHWRETFRKIQASSIDEKKIIQLGQSDVNLF